MTTLHGVWVLRCDDPARYSPGMDDTTYRIIVAVLIGVSLLGTLLAVAPFAILGGLVAVALVGVSL